MTADIAQGLVHADRHALPIEQENDVSAVGDAT